MGSNEGLDAIRALEREMWSLPEGAMRAGDEPVPIRGGPFQKRAEFEAGVDIERERKARKTEALIRWFRGED